MVPNNLYLLVFTRHVASLILNQGGLCELQNMSEVMYDTSQTVIRDSMASVLVSPFYSLGSLALGGASCHLVRILQPVERPIW